VFYCQGKWSQLIPLQIKEAMEALTKAQQELYDWLVDYIRTAQHAPSIRQMMTAMGLKSPAPIQSRLERLRNKGYISWTEGKARTIRITYPPDQPGVQILGAIRAGKLVEPFTDDQEQLDLRSVFEQPNCFALRVVGDSMIDDMILEGDFVLMRKPRESEFPHNGDIVAARVEDVEQNDIGTTLKRYYQEGNRVILQASNPEYAPIETEAAKVEIQGILIGVWRNCAPIAPVLR
jgi:repressor LexA